MFFLSFRNRENPSSCSNRTRSFSSLSKSSFSPFYVIVPLTMIIFVLSLIIVVLLLKPHCSFRRQCFQIQTSNCKENRDKNSSGTFSHSYTNTILYRTSRNRFRFDKKTCQHIYPVKTEFYSSMSSQSLPSLVNPTNSNQPLSVDRFLRSYV